MTARMRTDGPLSRASALPPAGVWAARQLLARGAVLPPEVYAWAERLLGAALRRCAGLPWEAEDAELIRTVAAIGTGRRLN